MTLECEVIRDLLPLYADEACSEQSRKLVNEHLLDCADCRDMLQKIRENEIENGLKREKESVLHLPEKSVAAFLQWIDSRK